jgi:hypothetical protein
MFINMTKHWNPVSQVVFELQNTEQTSALRIISAIRERPDWTSSTRVTLLGDAVHAPKWAGGIGAKAVLEDAASLVKLIVEESIFEKSIKGYIDRMWENAVLNIEKSITGGQNLLGFKGFESAKEMEFSISTVHLCLVLVRIMKDVYAIRSLLSFYRVLLLLEIYNFPALLPLKI